MFIINPDQYSLPCYRIGPFRTSDLSRNHTLPDSDLIEDYLHERFAGRHFIYTENGRKAINLALSYYKLQRDDVVSIITTTGNFYVSGCVTREIENFCKWSRTIVPETKIIFVNHEFGYPVENLQQFRNYNLPIIEDCASSFFSKDKNDDIGTVGDFIIYSFPKMFPLQIGGLLLTNFPDGLHWAEKLDNERLRHIKNVVSHHLKYKDEIIKCRLLNYSFIREKFKTLDFVERFNLDQDIVPGVFMFKTDRYKIDLPELKRYFWGHGVQCSVFYGEETFFVPVHQNLNEEDMLYFYEIIKSYIQKTRTPSTCKQI